jgi:ABC-type transporter Mla subunit MlaD
MSPEVTAAIIAAGVGILTLISTVIAQVIGFRVTRADTERQIQATHKDTADTLDQQREQLNRTLAEQRGQLERTLDAQSEQLKRTLAEQRIRTLNERFATAAEQLGSDQPAIRLLACTPWRDSLTTGRRTGRPASMSCALIYVCCMGLIRAQRLRNQRGSPFSQAAKCVIP